MCIRDSNFAGSLGSYRTGCSRISKTSQQSGIADVNQLVRDMLQSNTNLEKKIRNALQQKKNTSKLSAMQKKNAKKLNARRKKNAGVSE